MLLQLNESLRRWKEEVLHMLENKYGLKYELLFVGDSSWTEITSLIDSRSTKIEHAGCSTDLKSVVSKCDFEMKYSRTPSLIMHSSIVGKILAAKENNEIVKFRMSGFDSFVGKVDLGNFSQTNGRIPGFVSVTCEDNSYLLEEKMPTSFEYPSTSDLSDEGYSVFDKNNLAESIVMLRFLDAGYTINDIDIDNSDTIPEKVRRVVYDKDDKETYRDFLDTLLFEHCAIYVTTLDGKLMVKRLYQTNPVSERDVTEFLLKEGLSTKGGDYQFDGVEIKWSNLAVLSKNVVYNANISMDLDEDGKFVGEEIEPEHYYPSDGDIEEVWQDFDASFLDKPYLTKESRLKNKDLSLITVKNAYYEVDKDSDVILANNPPQIEPTKARVLFYNKNASDVKKIYGFTIVGDILYRNKINDSIYPPTANKLDDPYETKHIFNASGAEKLANHLHRFYKYGDLQHSWSEHNIESCLFQVITVAATDTLISSLAMIISQTRTYPAPNVLSISNNAIGVTAFNSEPVRTRSIIRGSIPVNIGPSGSSGTRSITQFSLGDADSPYDSTPTTVSANGVVVSANGVTLGTEGLGWTFESPTPSEGEFVWRREGYYTPPEVWPSVWSITRLTGASSFGITLKASSLTVPTSSRGVPRGGNITITALLQNIPSDTVITWSVTGISFDSITDNKIRVALVSTMTSPSAIITASCTFNEITYSSQVTLSKVADGKPAPYNFGSVTIVPTETPLFEPLVVGDYFLWAFPDPEPPLENTHTYGAIYEYTGTTWIESTNGDLVMTMFDSFAELANDVDSTVIGNAVIKKLVAINAFIETLSASEIKLLTGGSIHSDYYLPDGRVNESSTAISGFFVDALGRLKAKEAELIGTLKTGENAPIARVGIRDKSGIIDDPTFVGTGLDDLSIIVSGAVAVTCRVKMETIATVYAIGDTGPAGGTIFHIDDQTCYECAPASTQGYSPYSKTYFSANVGTSTNVGTGEANTTKIVNSYGTGDYAARYCYDLTSGGYSDWFLPSIDELNLMYTNLYLNGLHDLYEENYMSSSEYSDERTYHGQLFYNGNFYQRQRDNSAYVRAIRTFTQPYDTFKVSVDDGVSYGSEIKIPDTKMYKIPSIDITIAFGLYNGHTSGDYWKFVQGAMRGLAITDSAGNEYFSASNGVLDVLQINEPETTNIVYGAVFN